MSSPTRILYCHCAYAQVIAPDVKQAVLRGLAESGVAFEAVADLCELSAKRDPAMKDLVGGIDGNGNELRIAACFPRAVKGLFVAANVPLPETGVEICNMRTETAEAVVQVLINGRQKSETAEPVAAVG